MKTNNLLYIIILLSSVIFSSCSKMDEYKRYVEDGEIVYPTKIDSLQILSGKNQVMVHGLVRVNRGMTSYRVFWNNRRDSIVVPVALTENIDTLKHVIKNLPEGTINFEIRSYDDKGHSSVPTYLVGNVYGDRFREGMFQRAILDYAFDNEGKFNVTFQDVSKDMGFHGVRLKYRNVNDRQVDTVIVTTNVNASVALKDYVMGSTIDYATVFRPEPNSIDTFVYDKYIAFRVIGDVSEVYLKNYKKPFYPSDFDGNRWGTLLDWETNDAAKNHSFGNIMVGGYAYDGGGVAKLEAGWGAANIINGKIHQRILLPAGRYRFATRVTEEAWNGDIPGYLIANKGNQLSDYDNINSSTRLGSVKMTGGDVSFEFEVTETSTVSLGYVVNMTAEKWLTMEFFKLEIL
ncbi:DUF5013 domain-containing protein [Sphingobacterium olei]|uniref:DUF5013 domain-containing protein n=1 Tax=Sphingobacterium olei TaxID=2571155 RepID=A0A4U0NZ24_9SPHI|nr:DUF4998 domain-containing protein [Sphingobacterium olei]TJZ59970.1 DUF5013 domain-containing protein [Sphingobacterium olei]